MKIGNCFFTEKVEGDQAQQENRQRQRKKPIRACALKQESVYPPPYRVANKVESGK
jgi:hypothetical protein